MRRNSKLALLSGKGLAVTLACCFATEAMATEWNVSLWGSRRAFTEHVEKLAELVETKTNGEFMINISYGGLSKNRENLDGISKGAFEMAQFCAGYHAEKNKTITVLELPFLGVNTLEEEMTISHAIYEHPATAGELANWNAKLLMATPLPQYNLVGTGNQLQNLSWFDDVRIRATGGIGKAFATLGAEPVSLTATETFEAMESGDVEAVAFAQHAHFSFKTIDQADWWTSNLNPGSVNCPIVVNIDAYNALSPEHRAALDSSVAPALQHFLEYYTDLIYKWDEILELFEVEKVTIPQSEIDAFRERAAAPVHQQWIADMEAEGFPGQELYDLANTALEEIRNGTRPIFGEDF
ncbi:C4-dicarboxylate ABC transporter substrate-binding protein [Parasulfitobacter algicola]|uniref:C4-dicarboxylate ABC transporter substrate-binding protein n=1 Tax=Parasulfitobacter algicola TaxID=2614809 RepID=A0ABX2IR86_9RHOB|nr:C4-dicarboxylate ABC transporter substrate-binding protein [Sulfitobacter algicola]NSX53605.1 C4-dicarboxylate ABC transporter substrate-binding protein [Sulfitobacter algicola]